MHTLLNDVNVHHTIFYSVHAWSLYNYEPSLLCGLLLPSSFYLSLLKLSIVYKKILRAPDKAEKSGRFMVVLSMDTSDEMFKKLAQEIKETSEDKKIQEVNGIVAKIVTARLSEKALEKVNFWYIYLSLDMMYAVHHVDQKKKWCGIHRGRNDSNCCCPSMAFGSDTKQGTSYRI